MDKPTREQIEAMPAGREMDALVAEYVMSDLPPRGHHVDDYSTDIVAAWKVVEKFPYFEMWKNEAEITFRAEFYREYGKWNKWATFADTAPLAICRAALLAVLEI